MSRPSIPDVLDRIATDAERPRSYPPTFEVGRSGLRRASGYVQEEFLNQLKGRRGVQIFREMGDNSGPLAGFLRASENLLGEVDFRVEAASNSREHRADREFVEQNMQDMEHSFGDMVVEIASMIRYGWAVVEPVFKRRIGPWEKDPKRRSKYTDGRYGWQKIVGRAQESLLRWDFDEHGEILAMIQQPAPTYEMITLPMEPYQRGCLLFRTTTAKGNPEGLSWIRGAYQAWWYVKRLQEVEAVGMERDLAGMPFATAPAALFGADPASEEGQMLQAMKDAVKGVRRNENDGVVWPSQLDRDSKTPMYDFKLLASGGSRQIDTNEIINRYKTEMLQAVLSDFMQVGHEDNGGSYALHLDKTGILRTALNRVNQSIADVFNRHAIPRLFALNGRKPDELPRIVPGDVDAPNLAELGAFLTATANVGAQWMPDAEMMKFFRRVARLPEMDPQAEDALEVGQRQAIFISLAQQKLQAVQIEQQAQQGQLALEGQQMGNQQQAMGVAQQAQAMQAGPEGQDPNEAKRGQLALATDATKLEQEKAKLANLKASKPAKAPLKKSLSGFGVDHDWAGESV